MTTNVQAKTKVQIAEQQVEFVSDPDQHLVRILTPRDKQVQNSVYREKLANAVLNLWEKLHKLDDNSVSAQSNDGKFQAVLRVDENEVPYLEIADYENNKIHYSYLDDAPDIDATHEYKTLTVDIHQRLNDNYRQNFWKLLYQLNPEKAADIDKAKQGIEFLKDLENKAIEELEDYKTMWKSEEQKVIQSIQYMASSLIVDWIKMIKEHSDLSEKEFMEQFIEKNKVSHEFPELGAAELNKLILENFETDEITYKYFIRVVHYETGNAYMIMKESDYDTENKQFMEELKRYIAKQHIDSNQANGRNLYIMLTKDPDLSTFKEDQEKLGNIFDQELEDLFNPNKIEEHLKPAKFTKKFNQSWKIASVDKFDIDPRIEKRKSKIALALTCGLSQFLATGIVMGVGGYPLDVVGWASALSAGWGSVIGIFSGTYARITNRGTESWRTFKGAMNGFAFGWFLIAIKSGWEAVLTLNPQKFLEVYVYTLGIATYLNNVVKTHYYSIPKSRFEVGATKDKTLKVKLKGYNFRPSHNYENNKIFQNKMYKSIESVIATPLKFTIDNTIGRVNQFFMDRERRPFGFGKIDPIAKEWDTFWPRYNVENQAIYLFPFSFRLAYIVIPSINTPYFTLPLAKMLFWAHIPAVQALGIKFTERLIQKDLDNAYEKGLQDLIKEFENGSHYMYKGREIYNKNMASDIDRIFQKRLNESPNSILLEELLKTFNKTYKEKLDALFKSPYLIEETVNEMYPNNFKLRRQLLKIAKKFKSKDNALIGMGNERLSKYIKKSEYKDEIIKVLAKINGTIYRELTEFEDEFLEARFQKFLLEKDELFPHKLGMKDHIVDQKLMQNYHEMMKKWTRNLLVWAKPFHWSKLKLENLTTLSKNKRFENKQKYKDWYSKFEGIQISSRLEEIKNIHSSYNTNGKIDYNSKSEEAKELKQRITEEFDNSSNKNFLKASIAIINSIHNEKLKEVKSPHFYINEYSDSLPEKDDLLNKELKDISARFKNIDTGIVDIENIDFLKHIEKNPKKGDIIKAYKEINKFVLDQIAIYEKPDYGINTYFERINTLLSQTGLTDEKLLKSKNIVRTLVKMKLVARAKFDTLQLYHLKELQHYLFPEFYDSPKLKKRETKGKSKISNTSFKVPVSNSFTKVKKNKNECFNAISHLLSV